MSDSSHQLAIVGMSGRFPGARDLDAFWSNLAGGVESVSFFSDEEIDRAGLDPAALEAPNFVRAGAVLDDVERFDARFFGFHPREADVLDPQHRLLLECAWAVLEDAGYDPRASGGRIGVVAGASMGTYLLHNLYPTFYGQARRGDSLTVLQAAIGNEKDFLTTRLAYKLDLKGPCFSIQTACSTSLVAVHVACQLLLTGEADLMLAGGVSVKVPQRCGYLYEQGGIVSPDGHCRAFDRHGEGSVFGSGVGLVALKRLDDALADGDNVRAVILGSAVNNDGALKVGYTAPSVVGQAAVVSEALAVAGVSADTVSYVEAHGTGTPLGDPIEVAALTRAFRTHTERRGYCALGSLKTNVGHLDAAAGVAGLIKTVLALEHRALPASLHFEEPNPGIDFAASPFVVNAALRPWERNGAPRRAGVSAFGVGGTNAHVVVEEAPAPSAAGAARPAQLLVLSARTATALTRAADALAAHLDAHPDLPLADVAHTLRVGRRAFGHRRALTATSVADAVDRLRRGDVLDGVAETAPRPVVFHLPGDGGHHRTLASVLHRHEPVFREHASRCASLLAPRVGPEIRAALDGPAPPATHDGGLRFLFDYALARLWISWGVTPARATGAGTGAYVAQVLAGMLRVEDAVELVAADHPAPEGAALVPDAEALVLALGVPPPEAVDHPGVVWALAGSPARGGEDADAAPASSALLGALARLWLGGLPIEWPGLSVGERRRRVSLPTYPFEGERHWVEPSAAPAVAPAAPRTEKPALAHWFHVPVWQRAPVPPAPEPAPARRWLALLDASGVGDALADALAASGDDVVRVRPGRRFGRGEEDAFTISPDAATDYGALVKHLHVRDRLPTHIVHLWTLERRPDGDDAHGFLSLLWLAQALGNEQVDVPIHVDVVADSVHDVTGAESVHPAHAMLLGPCRVIPREYANLSCRLVDVAAPADADDAARLVTQLARELRLPPDDPVVAYRGPHRWRPGFEAVALPPAPPGGGRLRERGVYLVTGGLGGLGLAVAGHLARHAQARLALVGRSPLPPRSAWDAWLDEHDGDEATSRRIRAVRELEAAGASVLPLAADVADHAAMARALETAEARFGPIHGVVHAAGVPGGGLLQLKSADAAHAVLAPKVAGTLVLDALLGDRALDFFVAFSSISALTGLLGEADYAAANAFLDAFAQRAARRGRPTVSIDWAPWQWDAWTAGAGGLPPELLARGEELRRVWGISFAEGVEALDRILASALPQVVVSPRPLAEVVAESATLTLAGLAAGLGAGGPRHPRPALRTPYASPTTDLERRVTRLWEETLGIEQVGIHDNLFELGGSSLTAVQLVARLRAELDTQVPASLVFEAPTVHELAASLGAEESQLDTSLQRASARREAARGESRGRVPL